MELHIINTGNFKIDGGAMFGVVPKSIWKNKYPCDEDNLCNVCMRNLLVIDGDRKILIDAGFGDKQDEKFFSYYHLNGDNSLEKSFKASGYTYDDVTDVIFTHLHHDHCGGATIYNKQGELELLFKNAKLWISQLQMDAALKPNRREVAAYPKENITPLFESDKLELIKEDTNITPNIKVKVYRGHTDGLMVPIINYNGKDIIFVGDLMPALANMPIPYISSYDLMPLEVIKEKEEMLKHALDNDGYVFFQHDLYNECCNVQMTLRGIKVKDIFKLSEIL